MALNNSIELDKTIDKFTRQCDRAEYLLDAAIYSIALDTNNTPPDNNTDTTLDRVADTHDGSSDRNDS